MKNFTTTFILFVTSISSQANAQELMQQVRIDSITAFFESGGKVISNITAVKSRLKRLDRNSDYRIVLNGYTDTVGKAADNKLLASARLHTVADLLESHRLKITLLDSMNYNERRVNRLADDTKNRRVDIIIYRLDKNIVYDKPINLKINFQNATDMLLATAYPALDELYLIMLQDTSLNIRLDGHVCCTGDQQLSLDRAERVKKYLVRKGIMPQRITCRGLSNTVKLVPEKTPADEAKNRRVEVIFVK